MLKQIPRRLVVLIAVLTLIAAACSSDDSSDTTAAPGATQAPDTTAAPAELQKATLQIYQGATTSLFAQIGVDEGFYANHGLDIELVAVGSGPDGAAALASGSLDFAMTNMDVIMVSKDAGVDANVIIGTENRESFAMVAHADTPVPNIDKGFPDALQDLRGKRIGVIARGSSNERMARLLFEEAGIDPDEQEYVAVGGPGTALAAFETGQVDANFGFVPFPELVELTGQGVIVLDCRRNECGPRMSSLGCAWQGVYVTSDKINDNPELVQKFVDAHKEIFAWMKDPANRDEVMEIVLNRYTPPDGIDADEYANAVLDVQLTAAGIVSAPEGVELWNEILVGGDEISGPIDPADLLASTTVQECSLDG